MNKRLADTSAVVELALAAFFELLAVRVAFPAGGFEVKDQVLHVQAKL